MFQLKSCLNVYLVKKIIQAKHKAQHGRQHTENIEFPIMTVVNKEYIDPKSSVPAKLSKNTETPQKPVKSPSKIAQRKRKLVQKSLQNTTILSENLDPDVNNSRDESYIFGNLKKKTPLLIKRIRWAKNSPVDPLKTRKSLN